MQELTEMDIQKIQNVNEYNTKLLKLSIGNYYVKNVTKKEALMELFGKKLADIFEINAPEIYIIKDKLINYFGDRYFVLSKDLNSKGVFKTIRELELEVRPFQTSFYDIWNMFDEHPDIKVQMLDVIKIYILDILFSHEDRRTVNWGILFLEDGNQKITIIDNEYLMKSSGEIALFVERGLNIYKDFLRFMRESSEEYQELFKGYYDKLNPEFIKKLLSVICKENNLEYDIDKLIEDYTKHYNELGRIYEETRNRGDGHAR